MVDHVLSSRDKIILVVGDAGTGKTTAVKHAFRRIDRPIEIIAPSAEASRGVLRRDGFDADTVTAFLNSEERQERVKNGVIWVDEASMLPVRDLSRLIDIAKEQNARIVLQGDPKQHRSVARDGNMMRVLETHAGLPVSRLRDVKRQSGDYKKAVEALRDGHAAEGLKRLHALGWVRKDGIVEDYLAAIDANKSVHVIAPTHAEAERITYLLRAGMRAKKLIGETDHELDILVPTHWTEADRGDLNRYDGDEVVRWHHKSGTFKAGDTLAIADFRKGMWLGNPACFSVFRKSKIGLAVGDGIRITARDKSKDGHALDNGSTYTVAGFEKNAIRLTNGWLIDTPHLTHSYVTTSFGAQGKSVKRVLVSMTEASLPAMNAEQLYVSASRGTDQAAIYTDLSLKELTKAVERSDSRKAAVEVFQPKRRNGWWVKRARQAWQSLRQQYERVTTRENNRREYGR